MRGWRPEWREGSGAEMGWEEARSGGGAWGSIWLKPRARDGKGGQRDELGPDLCASRARGSWGMSGAAARSGTGLRPGNLRSGLCPAEGANPAASLWGCYSSSCPEFGALGLGAERRPWFPSPVPAFTRTTLCQFGLKGIGARAEGLVSSPFSVPILGTPGQRLGCCHHPQIVPPLLASMARPLSPSRTLQGLSVPCLT